jgi:preprotein translocase subunit SecG
MYVYIYTHTHRHVRIKHGFNKSLVPANLPKDSTQVAISIIIFKIILIIILIIIIILKKKPGAGESPQRLHTGSNKISKVSALADFLDTATVFSYIECVLLHRMCSLCSTTCATGSCGSALRSRQNFEKVL